MTEVQQPRAAIEPGKHRAKISGYCISKTNQDLPQVEIAFDLGDNKTLRWFGSLKSEAAQKITIKSLFVCGLATADLSALADGPASGALDMNKEVLLDCQLEPDLKGNPQLRVKWINEVGGAHFRNAIAKGEAVTKMAGLNLQATVMQVASESGYKIDPSKMQAAVAAQAVPAAGFEVPF